MISVLITLGKLEGVAVRDVLGDVPVVRGSPREPPQPEHLLGRAGRVANSLLLEDGRADAGSQGGKRSFSRVLVVSEENKFGQGWPRPGTRSV